MRDKLKFILLLSRWRSHVGKWIINVWTSPCSWWWKRGCQWDQEFHVFLSNICTKRWMEEWGLWQHVLPPVFVHVLGGFLCQGTWPSFSDFLFLVICFLICSFWFGVLFVCGFLFACLGLVFYSFFSWMYLFAVKCIVNNWGAAGSGKIMSTFVSTLPHNYAQMSRL